MTLGGKPSLSETLWNATLCPPEARAYVTICGTFQHALTSRAKQMKFRARLPLQHSTSSTIPFPHPVPTCFRISAIQHLRTAEAYRLRKPQATQPGVLETLSEQKELDTQWLPPPPRLISKCVGYCTTHFSKKKPMNLSHEDNRVTVTN